MGWFYWVGQKVHSFVWMNFLANPISLALRHLQTVFYSGCINLYSQQAYKNSPFSTSPPTSVICGLFDNSYSDRCEVIAHCGLVCTSLMISNAEHLCMGLLAICMSSLEKCLFRSSAHFLIGFFVFWYWVVWAVYIFWI